MKQQPQLPQRSITVLEPPSLLAGSRVNALQEDVYPFCMDLAPGCGKLGYLYAAIAASYVQTQVGRQQDPLAATLLRLDVNFTSAYIW